MSLFPTSVDDWTERFKLRVLITGVIGVLVSGCSTYTETRYLIFGKTTQAEVINVFDNAKSSDRHGTWSVKYKFEDRDGTVRNEEDYDSGGLSMEGAGSLIDIEYIPGSLEDSRLLGHNRRWGVIPFLVCVVLMSIAGVKFMKEYREHERRSGRD